MLRFAWFVINFSLWEVVGHMFFLHDVDLLFLYPLFTTTKIRYGIFLSIVYFLITPFLSIS